MGSIYVDRSGAEQEVTDMETSVLSAKRQITMICSYLTSVRADTEDQQGFPSDVNITLINIKTKFDIQ